MLDIKFIRENSGRVRQAVKDKNEKTDLETILRLDDKRRMIIGEVEKLKAEKNALSREIGALLKDKKDCRDLMAKTKKQSGGIKKLDEEEAKISGELRRLLLTVPNLPHKSVPGG